MRLASISIFSAVLLACSGLPSDWEEASSAANLSQSACTGSPADLEQGTRRERIEIRAVAGGLHVDYRDAHFRCEQRVTAHARRSGSTIEVLVQPADMNPMSVAKCDCLYDIGFEIPNLPAGTYAVTLQRRWDNKHSPNDPVVIGSERVTVN